MQQHNVLLHIFHFADIFKFIYKSVTEFCLNLDCFLLSDEMIIQKVSVLWQFLYLMYHFINSFFSITYGILTPFYCASLVETVQVSKYY